mmetsp:Transcript_20313/g.51441  ORF Transcript_20313/g.51441 Transcript_20313/m.51441 type:complete len:200 (-) Transcript_20313:135-734(-)
MLALCCTLPGILLTVSFLTALMTGLMTDLIAGIAFLGSGLADVLGLASAAAASASFFAAASAMARRNSSSSAFSCSFCALYAALSCCARDSRNCISSSSSGLFFPVFICFHLSSNAACFASFASRNTSANGFNGAAVPSSALSPRCALIVASSLSVTNFRPPNMSRMASASTPPPPVAWDLACDGNTEVASLPSTSSLS